MTFSHIEFLETSMRKKALTISDALRHMADEVDRIAKNDKLENIPSYVIHAVTWGVANLQTHQLTSIAQDLIDAKFAEIEVAVNQWEVDGDDLRLVNETIDPILQRKKQ